MALGTQLPSQEGFEEKLTPSERHHDTQWLLWMTILATHGVDSSHQGQASERGLITSLLRSRSSEESLQDSGLIEHQNLSKKKFRFTATKTASNLNLQQHTDMLRM